MKLSKLLNDCNVLSSGFPAIAALGEHSKGSTPVVLSSLPAAVLHSQGITEYYSLVLPRGTTFNTAEDIIKSDPEVKKYRIETVDTAGMPKAITTQHQATLDVLAELYPDAEIISQRNADGTTRNLTPEDVAGKHVIGVLPPFLVAAAGAFTSASVAGYNAATDGDLSGDALKQRLQIADTALKVTQIYKVVIGYMDTHDPRYGSVTEKEMTKKDLINWITKESEECGKWGMGSHGIASVTIDRYHLNGSDWGWFSKEDDQKLFDYVKSLA
ncbi:hypothetical protein [Paenibacillus phocaensis]|uniref:hypothetical protein n=1 Tax=Paenibacillus phocaensis TaxID=1776378 RepID=UPI000839B268|nr:hypothetical protein [Paenibacillus phocaensis]